MSCVETQTFKFSELSERAKQSAIGKHAEPDHAWWESTYEQYTEEGVKRGFDIVAIGFHGFSFQGSGASWGGRIDLERYFKHKQETAEGPAFTRLEALIALAEAGEIEYATVSRSSFRGQHEYTMRVEWLWPSRFDGDETKIKEGPLAGALVDHLLATFMSEAQCSALEEEMLEDARAYAREIYKALEAEYESFFEEENFSEHADINEWRFTEEGTLT